MRRWAAALLAVAGLLLIVGAFVPFVRSGPCCMALLPGRFLVYADATLAIVAALVIVAAPRRHRTPSPSVVGSS